MKKISLFVGLVIIIFLGWWIAPTYYQSYQDNKIEAEQAGISLTNGAIIIGDKLINHPNMACGSSITPPGMGLPTRTVMVTLENKELYSSFRVSFIGGEYEDTNNLLKVGVNDPSSGLFTSYSQSTFVPDPRDMDIHINSLSLNGDFINSASGYIHIKRKIEFPPCPKELEGVPQYKCTHRGEFLPIQKIGFSCSANN